MLPLGGDLDFTSRQLLEALGYEATPLQEGLLEILVARFGAAFPTTADFSLFARSTVPDIDANVDPDGALVAWMDQEESLYRTLEKHIVGSQLDEAASDVDRTLAIAMRTFQRRRSRAGHALENHVAEILRVNGIEFERQAITEGRSRPDFLFPGRAQYRDPEYESNQLRMLAVKTTCKDRWRQILTEAARIPVKHLLTLESPISPAQLREMGSHKIVLVVPSNLQAPFRNQAGTSPLSVRELLVQLRSGTT
jgi:hypothetical protein